MNRTSTKRKKKATPRKPFETLPLQIRRSGIICQRAVAVTTAVESL